MTSSSGRRCSEASVLSQAFTRHATSLRLSPIVKRSGLAERLELVKRQDVEQVSKVIHTRLDLNWKDNEDGRHRPITTT